ncbi:MAG: 2Fe-2S iron-sulfur cluster-binding protein, partial [Armatimonadota bacterium]
MSELVTLTIDGRQVRVEPNTLIVEAAAQLGVLVPVYCYHPKLAPVGACRMCLVEIEGMPKLTASCTTPVKEGMVVQTQNARVKKAREGILEFLLVQHPLDCPVCDKGGECPLQDYTYEFGPTKSRFRYPKRHWDKPIRIGKNILLDRERCVMCYRCVRFCQEITDHEQVGVFNRGNNQVIGVVLGHAFDSQFSGNTVELCPVGALTAAPTRFFGRTWDVRHAPSICTGCATGCNVRVDHRHDSEVVRLWSRQNSSTDAGWLCDGGRFGSGFVNDDRLIDCLVKQQGELVEA